MHKNPKFVRLVLMAVALLGLSVTAAAQPKPNVFDGGDRWLITAYDDTSPVHAQMATQSICFLPYAASGTHIQGVWFSTSFPNWRGRYSQEGDRVLMHGDYANGVGHDGMEIELFAGTSPADEGAGQWTEWRETGPFGTNIAFANTRLRRVGRCKWPSDMDITKINRAEAEKIAVDLSSKVPPRKKRDGKVAESPAEPGQVPLPDVKE
jgi:hypothetical protein